MQTLMLSVSGPLFVVKNQSNGCMMIVMITDLSILSRIRDFLRVFAK